MIEYKFLSTKRIVSTQNAEKIHFKYRFNILKLLKLRFYVDIDQSEVFKITYK
jgi:hypothetical protein